MKKTELDDLLKRGVLSREEYNEFFKTMSENERGEMVGGYPKFEISSKYHFDGNLICGNLLNFVLTEIVPPYESEYFDESFKKYGVMICGIGDYWHWFTKDNITEEALKNGHRPVEEATELELWKMIAIASRYWETSYKRWYREKTE